MHGRHDIGDKHASFEAEGLKETAIFFRFLSGRKTHCSNGGKSHQQTKLFVVKEATPARVYFYLSAVFNIRHTAYCTAHAPSLQ